MWGLNKIGEQLGFSANRPAGTEAAGRSETFDDYLRRVIFPKEQYELRRVVFQSEAFDLAVQGGGAGQAPEPETPESALEQGLLPVYTFRCNQTGQEFLVDADFREALYYPDRVEWCKPGRLKRYREVAQAGIPFFLTLGLGRKGYEPEAVYIIPVSQTTGYSGFSKGPLATYAFPTDAPIVPDHLWRLHRQ